METKYFNKKYIYSKLFQINDPHPMWDHNIWILLLNTSEFEGLWGPFIFKDLQNKLFNQRYWWFYYSIKKNLKKSYFFYRKTLRLKEIFDTFKFEVLWRRLFVNVYDNFIFSEKKLLDLVISKSMIFKIRFFS